MKHSIRKQFFTWLGLQTLISFFIVSLVVVIFNIHEQHEHPDMAWEEKEEGLIVVGIMTLLFPLALGSAWMISRKLLQPWQQLVLQSERMAGGYLNERITVQEPRDEIGRLATTLNTAFDNHQYLADRLNRFSFDASHQLRNPLAAIQARGEVCLQSGRTAEEYQLAIGDMLDNAKRLGRTVDHLLTLARTTRNSLDTERRPLLIQDLLGPLHKDVQIVAESRSITITLDTGTRPLTIAGNADLIREALANILDNAIRYSPDNGTIRIQAQRTPLDRIRIAVIDQGPGLSAQKRGTLFRPALDSRSVDADHIGLGLAIAADICRAHGGLIGVDDNPGGGCVFWMEFPPES